MRILITTDVVGGVWQFAKELTTGLLQKRCAVALVSFGGAPSTAQRQWCERLSSTYRENFRYEASPVPLEWMEDNGRAYREVAPLLIEIAKGFQVDLIHANQFCFGALPFNVPKVVTAHSDVLSWAEACRNEPLENSAWLRQYCRLVNDGLHGATVIAAPTRWMLSALARHFSFRTRGAVIPNGRSVPRVRSVGRKMQAITAGRLWDEAKDIEMLKRVSSPIPLLAAGETQHGSTQAAPFGNVELLGSLSEEDLLRQFRESAIYICTSRYEPFGLAPLEAALCGCAVLARDIPSLREVWGEGALYFTDAASLSSLLRSLSADSELLQSSRRKSLRRARCFTAERMVNAYYAEFRRSIAETEQYVA